MPDPMKDSDIVACLTLTGEYEIRQYVAGEPVLLVERVYDRVAAEAEAVDLAHKEGSDAWIQEAQAIFRCLTVAGTGSPE